LKIKDFEQFMAAKLMYAANFMNIDDYQLFEWMMAVFLA